MAESTGDISGVIADRYRIDREIGRGGMATVYLARDLRHDSQVAVKVLRPELAQMLGGERFVREIHITASLQHTNILPIFDSGEHEGLPFYVMPYVDGESLEQRLNRTGALPIEEAIGIAAEVADALTHAHGLGFVHRDVKPSNILLSHGHAMLADFGIARAADVAGVEKLTQTGLALGTVSYMSPEQASGGEVDARSDVYSLGCVLYEMLTGTQPFTGPPRVVLARHSMDPAPRLRTVRETITPELEAAVLKAMAKLPVDRFADSASFKQAIRAPGTAGVPLVARPTRGRTLAVAAGMVTLLLTAVLWRVLSYDGSDLDANRIMVFPLVIPENFAGPRSVGEDVATMIGNALDGSGPLRWIDGWALLDAEKRDDIRLLTLEQARDLARDRRCAYFVTGRLVAPGDSAEVFLELRDARGGEPVARGSAKGLAADAWRPGLLAVNEILPALVPGSSAETLVEWRDRDPAAIQNFLLGESAFRRIHLTDALRHFRDAVRADSTFWLAAIRGAQAATWSHRSSEAASLIAVAKRQPLAGRYAQFVAGYEAFLEGRADSAAAAFRSALRIDPDMATAWMQLGEVYVHLLPQVANADSLGALAFEQAAGLDPAAANPLFHLIEILLRNGQVRRAEPIVARFLAAGPDPELAQKIRIMVDCARDGATRVDWSGLARTQPFPLLTASSTFLGTGSNHGCAEPGFAALLATDTAATPDARNRRFFALVGMQAIRVAQGRAAEAVPLIDAFVTRWGEGSSLHLLAAPFIDEFATRAAEIARADAARWGEAYEGTPFDKRLWLLGVLEADRGRPDIATAVARELDTRARRSQSRRDRLMTSSLEAWVALARGDSAEALRRFDALLSTHAPADDLKWDEIDPLGGERLTLARLYAARGDPARAIAVADVLDSPSPAFYPILLRSSLLLRAEAAAALGDARLEAHFRDRLAALQGDR